MTPWEFAHCVEGWKEANSAEEKAPPPMDDDKLAELGIVGF
ncbi:hypothetical protein [Rhizobium sp. ARZ01]|nr:hypothetical protein [Rhizobium sp. ARZ01]